jgi:chemotaxis response regulator CheB
MSIKVLLADGNAVMRPVIAKVLKEEPAIELVVKQPTSPKLFR